MELSVGHLPHEATFADSTKATTSVDLPSYGTGYDLTFTATPPEGSSDKAQTATETITTKMLPARITSKKVNGTKYEFSANTSGTGLPNEGVTYVWTLLNRWSLGTGSSIDFLFNSAQTTYEVELTTKIGNKTIGTTEVDVTTGDAVLPKVTASKDGSNPLVWTVKADVGGTNVNDDWTRQWYIDGKAVKGATNTYTLDSYEFALTDHKYEVEFAATNTLPDGVTTDPVTRSATITVTTGAATAPKLSSSAGSSDLNFNVKADLTDTGITDAWSYQWSSTPEATFKDATATSTDVEFASGGVAYTISFTATPPEGSSDKAQTATETITTKMLPADITVTPPTSGLLYTFSADTQYKGLPSSGATYDWSVGDTQIAKNTSASSISYLFDKAGDYQVSLTTYVNGKQIGKVQTTDVKVTADAIKPTLTKSQDGKNPLVWTVTADTKGTNIGSGWTYTWSSDDDGVTFTGATKGTITADGTSVSTGVDFTLTKHTYTVEFIATSPKGVVRSNSLEVDTPTAVKPKLTYTGLTYTGSGVNYNVTADLTDTGISKDNGWTYQWIADPAAYVTFTDSKATSTSVKFPYIKGETYILKFIATAPAGSGDKQVIATKTINIPAMLPARIDIKNNSTDVTGKGWNYQFTVNKTGTGLPQDATYVLKLDGKELTLKNGQASVWIADLNTEHTISLETQTDQGSIGTVNAKFITPMRRDPPGMTATDQGGTTFKFSFSYSFPVGSYNNVSYVWKIYDSQGNFIHEIDSPEGVVTAIYTFPKPNTNYEVHLYTKYYGKFLPNTGTIKRVNSGGVIVPKLSYTSGDDPLDMTVSVANIADTGIDGDNWTYQWHIDDPEDNKVISNSYDKLDFEASLTGHTYNVSYIATNKISDGATRSASIQITTGNSKPPKVSYTKINDSNYSLSVDFTNTGIIKSGWSTEWTSSEAGVSFSDPTNPDTKVYIPDNIYNKAYKLTFTAKQTDEKYSSQTQTVSINISPKLITSVTYENDTYGKTVPQIKSAFYRIPANRRANIGFIDAYNDAQTDKNYLTFICASGYHMSKNVLNLPSGNSIANVDVNGHRQTKAMQFYAGGWHLVSTGRAVNNKWYKIVDKHGREVTGLGCFK